MERFAVALFLGFFALLAVAGIGLQLYGLTGIPERRRAGRGAPPR